MAGFAAFSAVDGDSGIGTEGASTYQTFGGGGREDKLSQVPGRAVPCSRELSPVGRKRLQHSC